MLKACFVHPRCRSFVIVSTVPYLACGASVMFQKKETGDRIPPLSNLAFALRMAAWLQRLHGELLLMAGQEETKIVASFHDALTAARRQQAKSWEPRAAMSLSRLWQ